jgi:hypothetical protein
MFYARPAACQGAKKDRRLFASKTFNALLQRDLPACAMVLGALNSNTRSPPKNASRETDLPLHHGDPFDGSLLLSSDLSNDSRHHRSKPVGLRCRDCSEHWANGSWTERIW